MKPIQADRRSLFLLLSVLTFLVLGPFVHGRVGGELILMALMYVTLVAAALKLSESRRLVWPARILVISSMLLMAASNLHPIRPLVIANFAVLTIFLGLVVVGLFTYLGRPGAISSGHLYGSVSLYLILSMLWYAIFNVVNAVDPRSFVVAGTEVGTKIHHTVFLYFSMVTLTTLGYGDVLPVSPVSRMFSGLEAATGILYIAITVARLVAAYQVSERGRE